MASPPFPGELGETVRRQVCAPCWKEWLGAQVNIINEHRLSMLKPEHRSMLTAQMRAYLSLPD
jgi:Fe-S cluster biosynthesis and repair protein YggX